MLELFVTKLKRIFLRFFFLYLYSANNWKFNESDSRRINHDFSQFHFIESDWAWCVYVQWKWFCTGVYSLNWQATSVWVMNQLLKYKKKREANLTWMRTKNLCKLFFVHSISLEFSITFVSGAGVCVSTVFGVDI